MAHFMKSSPNKWFLNKVSMQSTIQGPTQRVFSIADSRLHNRPKKIVPEPEGAFTMGKSVLGENDVVVFKNKGGFNVNRT